MSYLWIIVMHVTFQFWMQTKEIQEELAMDMKMLEQMLQETTDEAMLSQQKKVRVTIIIQ